MVSICCVKRNVGILPTCVSKSGDKEKSRFLGCKFTFKIDWRNYKNN